MTKILPDLSRLFVFKIEVKKREGICKQHLIVEGKKTGKYFPKKTTNFHSQSEKRLKFIEQFSVIRDAHVPEFSLLFSSVEQEKYSLFDIILLKDANQDGDVRNNKSFFSNRNN